ncbi:hypothetical protein Trydic_g1793 [Trypoxylus dichotomus]
MHDYLQKYQILNESQYGYRKIKGTIDLLEHMADIVNGKLNEHKHVLCLFIDFSKAFDRINHDKLLKILEDLGIRELLLDWFRCYLTNRRFCVKVGNELSSLQELKAGVPQGSILGPLLYLLYETSDESRKSAIETNEENNMKNIEEAANSLSSETNTAKTLLATEIRTCKEQIQLLEHWKSG